MKKGIVTALIGLLAFLLSMNSRHGWSLAVGDDSQSQRVRHSIWSQPAAGIDPQALPLGNGKYSANGPRQGFIYACDPGMFRFPEIIGARVTGPWVHEESGTYDITRKINVRGLNLFSGRLRIATSWNKRFVSGNGLPIGASTGTFPVRKTDPAFYYDSNPNSVTAQDISFSLPLHPVLAQAPSCIYKRVGITLDGVELDGPLDSSGRDENAYELTDACGGKPQPGGSYHRHTLSDCVPHIREKNALVGYALDGFGIFSPFDGKGKELTSKDLDVCHGTTSEIQWDGKSVSMYHYVLTRDYPYSVACFRGAPNYDAFPRLAGLPWPIRMRHALLRVRRPGLRK